MKINYDEVFRYLGYKKSIDGESIDAAVTETTKQIDDCVAEIEALMAINSSIFGIYEIDPETNDSGVVLKDTVVMLEGQDIAEHLAGCGKCALMAVTLGINVEKRLAYYSRFNLTRAIVMDATASAYVEAICDEVEQQIAEEAAMEQLRITDRYSPGYGDLPLHQQKGLLRVLDAERKLGLTLTDTNLLVPRKSVTALIGLYDKDANRTQDEKKLSSGCSIGKGESKCSTCNMKNCRFRRSER